MGSTYLLISRGNLEGGVLQFHFEMSPSSAAVNLESIAAVGAVTETWLVQVHGVCMILAWMAAAASGMLMARYYKKTWKSVKPFEKDLRFRLHQAFMTSAVVLTILGILVILIDKGLEPYKSVNIP